MGSKCGTCNGFGYIIDVHYPTGKETKVTCSSCGGSGQR